MYFMKLQYLIFIWFLPFIKAKCNDTSKNILFISEYVKWRKISFMVLLNDEINSACNFKMIKDNLNMFLSKNIYFATHSSIEYSEATLNITKGKTAVVTFLDSNFTSNDFLEQANKISQYGEKASWLILATCHLHINIMDLLRYAHFGIHSDVVLAFDDRVDITNNQTGFMNNTKFNMLQEANEVYLPFKNVSNQTSFTNSSVTCVPLLQGSNQEMYHLYQLYKIRKTYNTSLVVRLLGIWDSSNSTKNLKPFWDLEDRGNFHQFPLIVGYYDTVNEGPMKENEIEANQLYFVNYFAAFLNSSIRFFGYNKLGHRDNGEWTDLIEAIDEDEIDISGQGISKTTDRISGMTYSLDILKNSRNIYVEPEKSEMIRDIFLTPFDTRLIFCVIATGLILSIAMTINNYASAKFKPTITASRRTDFSESIVWCIGIFSQQGSIWKTRSMTEKIVVIVALFLTVLIYNSYSAFITSVLSVELYSIRSVDDLLESDYKIGYAKESQDEDYLRSTNISELKQIYLRGYLQNDINNISDGLGKVIDGNFALFASGQVVRTQLFNMTKGKCKFDVYEINLKCTIEYMGFLMSKRSTIKKLINLSIIKMYETGVYRYIYSIIYPNIVRCDKPKTFQSARLADLSTAFFIVITAWAASFSIMIAERFWIKRTKIYKSLKKRIISDSEDFIITNNNIRNRDFTRNNLMLPRNSNFGRSNLLLPPTDGRVKYFDFVK